MTETPHAVPERAAYASALRQKGVIAIPLCAASKHMSFGAMQLPPYHVVTARKRLKDVAYQSVAFHLALRPPSADESEQWFADASGNIGIVTGYRGLIVLDFDSPSAYRRWCQRYSSLAKSTPVARSRSGFHVYLTCARPTRCSSMYVDRRKAGHIKGLGGYVVCSPSRVDGRTYAWLPGQSLLEMDPIFISSLSDISIHPTGWLRRTYDGVLGRGYYEPEEDFDWRHLE
ncbi:bifunctional DNA primase/polymerase [Pseudohoeflea coraliihabitans]|uniref:Bifunctional DNA primase/polymerase n=1 Tax=Pseudohoeflea coraliihabitans TaxID=2860393 RepID=A0ABS6WQS8_9HYPH|nr:bifunctional DNA primase/polymerase [Pseudohoeflea sp. DP4N28-3]MBW3098308.1 bifunctional DNA primase/polymerase [Pseudohoeflea sp. DP4N28-3]